MTGKTHRVIGLASVTTYFLSSSNLEYSPATFGVVLVGAYFASLIPDLDRSTADFWENLPLGRTVGKVVDPLIKHRNISHSILGLAGFAILIFFLLKSFPTYWGVNANLALWSIIISYCSHLLADMFTVDGIPLFYPLKKPFGIPPKPFDGIRILTGQWFENLILFPAVDIYFALLIYIKWSTINLILFK